VGETPVKAAKAPVSPAALTTSPDLGPPVEQQVATDMIRRSLPVLPALVLIAGLIWGIDGALSAAFAIGLVFLNFLFSASLLAWSARISLALMMVAALGGFILRLALITVAVLLVKDQSWVSLVPLGFTIIITHLGLLIWETRHLSLSLAYPTTKPRR
jgi:hypothetical protein